MARARESLSRRLDALGDRVARLRHAVDVPSRIAEHPWRAVAIALAAGVFVGRRRRSPHGPAPRSPLRDAAIAVITAAATKLIRDAIADVIVRPRRDATVR